MANVANRSPWVVEAAGHEPRQFPRKKKAQEWANSVAVPGKRPPKVYQLETAFEVQVIRKDAAGNVVRRSGTFDTRREAEAWGETTEREVLQELKDKHGVFRMGVETLSIRQGLERLHEVHYAKLKSRYDNLTRMPQIWKYFGENTLLRTIEREDIQAYRDWLIKEGYEASSVRNFVTVVSKLFKYAASEWNLPLKNPCQGVMLPKKDNAIRRNWRGNEEETLLNTIEQERPWILPIVKLALALTFRMGELVAGPKSKKTGEQHLGLMWQDVDFKEETITLRQEKNDGSKSASEHRGRVVPLSADAKAILLPLYEEARKTSQLVHGEPVGPIFQGTKSSVGKAFKHCTDKAGIEDFTFHTTRKIGTYEVSKKVPNAMLLSRITGHKNIEVLNKNYFEVPIDDLKRYLNAPSKKDKESSRATTQELVLIGKGIEALAEKLGEDDAQAFLRIIKKVSVGELAQ
ncbi:MAG: tyrosine-type recombinase/integrase [Variovorax sp.]|nr:tyrosine-type recombinase/integrase [Variovorax sp.]